MKKYINLRKEVWEKLDELRGESTRSAWISDMVKRTEVMEAWMIDILKREEMAWGGNHDELAGLVKKKIKTYMSHQHTSKNANLFACHAKA